MKKILLIAATAAFIAGSFASCKPKQSAYRKQYEKAKQREIANHQQETAGWQAPANEPNEEIKQIVISKPETADVSVRREAIRPAQGEDASRMKAYGVVIGSFQNHTNARALKERMESMGYRPVLGQNDRGMLRVIVESFNSKREAAAARETFKAKFAPQFQDAWILERM